MMKAALRSLAMCVGLCLTGLAIASPVAFAEGSSALGGTGESSLESPLVVTEALPLFGDEAISNVEAARRTSPEAVAEREESPTKYEGLDTEEAAKLAGEVFPGVVDQSAGGPPPLPEGQHIADFTSANSAQIDLGEGKRAALESMLPIATKNGTPGQWSPVDLGVSEAGEGFRIANPVVGVGIPKRLQEGVSLTGTGVSLTPVDAAGTPVGGSEGRVDGSIVFYGGVAVGSDVDELVKPEIDGFSEDAILRSIASPEKLFYRVGLPAGASLEQGSEGSVEVVDNGNVVASILTPTAEDAEGNVVPVSMAFSGDALTLTVAHIAGAAYPIRVDPDTATDNKLAVDPGNWHFYTDNTGAFKPVPEKGQKQAYLRDEGEQKTYSNGQIGEWEYLTQGASDIYEFLSTFTEYNYESNTEIVNRVAIRRTNGEKETGPSEVTEPLTHTKTQYINVKVCGEDDCQAGAKTPAVAAIFEQEAIESNKGNFQSTLESAAVSIYQTGGPSASFDTTDATIAGQPNALLAGKWVDTKASPEIGLDSRDKGIGIEKEGLSSPNKSGWGFAFKNETRNECEGVQCNECYEPPCKGESGVSGNGEPLSYSLASAEDGELPEGEDTIEGKVEDAVGLSATATAKIKVDNAPPHSITLSELPSNHEISDGQHYLLKSSAIDGTEGTTSSGIASILLDVDGQSITGPQGSCSPGPCTGHAEWTLNGENYAAGEHTLTVVATDNAGNVETAEYHVTIHHAEGVAVGPGSVNPVTGELSLAATDVSLSVPGGMLTVGRSYRSRHLAQGTEGPLGPQWNLSLVAEQSLSRVTGGMILTGGAGGQIVFESKGKGEFTSPAGDAGLTLVEKPVEGKTVFTLGENGSVTTFELPTGSSGSVWMPSSVEGPNGTNMTLYKFKVANGVIEPTEELAPVPANVTCGKEISELKEGCRALKFEYDEGATTAKGEKASEWGEFTKHLSKVRYIAWNASKTKTESVVAEYAYDVKGRLRAEWNPEVKPSPLKTTYGYDTEGHVTAVSTAGHEPELLEQGTIPSDVSPGRLLAVAVPSAGTGLGSGEAPGIKEVPTLSSTKPVVGTRISVNLTSEKTPGTWTGSPLAFIYQWEDCNSSGKECSPIPGAVNQAYYPVAGDEGHTLVAEATALNGTGAVTAETLATSTVGSGTPNTPLPEPPTVGSDAVTTLEYQVPVSGSGAPYEMSSTELAKWGQTDDPSEAMAMAVFPPDKVMGWPAKEYKREAVYYLDGKDRAVNMALPTGGISATEYNLYNDVIRTLTPDNRLKAISEGCKAKEECKSATENTYEEKGSEPGTELLSTLGPQHTVKLAVGKEGKANEEALARDHTTYFYNEGAPTEGGPYHLVTKTIDGAETASKEEFDKRTTETSYSGQSGLGWKLRRPTSATTDPGGLDLVHTTEYNGSTGDVVETKMPAAAGKDVTVPPAYASQFGSYGTEKETGKFKEPRATAIAGTGNVYVMDTGNSRVEEFSASGSFLNTFGKEGPGNGEFKNPYGIAEDSKGNLWIADTGNNRVQEFNSKNEYHAQFGKEGAGVGQLKEPKGIAVTTGGYLFVVDAGNNRIDKFKENGEFVLAFGYGVSNGKEEFQICTTSCQAGLTGSGNGEFNGPRGIAVSASGEVLVADAFNDRVEEFNEKGEYITKFGSAGKGNGQFEEPKAITTDSAGHVWVTDTANDRIQELSSSGAYMDTFGAKGTGNGQFEEPWSTAITSTGDVYVADVKNDRIEEWAPTVTGNEGAHDTKTIYYSKEANSEYKECGEHPEMANLPCETRPAAQPGTSELPELPTTKYTYNVWSEPETTVETVGSTKRTKTNTYDSAGRLKNAAITSSVGEKLSTITDEYNKETGALEKQCANEGKLCTEGKPKTITSIYNKLGQLESYTDADENTTTYEYEKEKDGRLKTVNDKEGTEALEYSETTGLLTEVLYTNGTTKLPFTATYDVEGNMLTESYPNGMTATYTYNQVGKPTSLVYKKTTNCTEEEKEKCKWFKDTIVPSIHGQWLEQTSTLSRQAYAYDNAGRLTQVQNTPANGKCTTRIYAYDEDTNRTSLTAREPGPEGKCATEGGKVQEHTYDTADRLTDPGIAYNTFGDITTLPANDAEESAEHALTSTYYTDNQVASQKQNEQTIGYNFDPAGRTLETISTGKPNNSTIISHYAGPGNDPAWTVNAVSGEWRRNITGISGSLVAIQNNGETPELQLTNLHGDIIAKAYLSETATELAARADTSEFGVPTVTTPAKYAWLGASELPTELPSGVVTMGARSYVPQIGRFVQPDPVPGGSANAYSYTFGDPVNSTDPTGDYTNNGSIAIEQALSHEAEAAAAARQAAAEAAARAAAEKAAREAAEAAAVAAGPQYEGEEEWDGEEGEEWGEEEGGYEYASYHHGANSEGEEHHIEPALLVQSLGEEAGESEAGSTLGSVVSPCRADSKGPCASNAIAGSPCIGSGSRCHGPGARIRRTRVQSPGARATHGRGHIAFHGGAIAGCIVGGVAGGTFAAATTAGLGTEAGAYGGCFIVGGAVIIIEDIF
jgi:RHS repeat-associated protein